MDPKVTLGDPPGTKAKSDSWLVWTGMHSKVAISVCHEM